MYKRLAVLTVDVLLIPLAFFFKWLSGVMLSRPNECPMVTIGGKCVTCGGTHFVQSILSFRIYDALCYNPFLFALSLFLLVSFVLLNVYLLFGALNVKKLLLKLYSIPSLIIWLSAMLLFFIIRNIHLFKMIIGLVI
jgi:hypothetical protein